MIRALRFWLALAVIGIWPVAAKAAAAKDSSSLVSVTVQLKWKHQFQFAGYYMAREKGFYADAGMDVRFFEAVIGQEPMNEVIKGRADFGVGTTDLLLMRNKGLAVVVLAAIFQHSPLAIMVTNGSGIWNVHQLAQKKLMIEPHSAELFAYFSKEGVDLDRMDLIDHTFNTSDLVQGRVDGMSAYTTDEPFLLKDHDTGIHLLRPIESGIDFYGDNLFTMENTIRDHPARVESFVAATRKGWVYALNNIDETVDVILSKYGNRKSRAHLLFEAERTKSLILPDVVEIGYINPLRWERIAQSYMDLGLLPKDFSMQGLIYSPARKQIPDWVWQVIAAAAAVILLILVITSYVLRINYQLRISEKQLSASNLHKETLLSIIGHDVKGPIFTMRMYGELLVSEADTLDRNGIVDHGRKILRGIDSALNVLDNLLQWATLQQKDRNQRTELVELAPIVERNLILCRLHAEAKNVTMSATGLEGATVLGHEWRIDTVVRNLLNNALKFTKSGDSISVSVTASGDYLDLVIEDTGSGMSDAALASVFAPNRQHSTGTIGETGTGFGLPLCKQLIETIGGEMALKNSAEGGLQATIKPCLSG